MRKLELRPCVVEQEGLALQTVDGTMATSQLQGQLLLQHSGLASDGNVALWRNSEATAEPRR